MKITSLMSLALLCVTAFIPLQVEATDNIRVTPVVKAFQNAKPSVVNISTTEEIQQRQQPFGGFGADPFFDRFFRDFFDFGFQGPSVRTSLGSGVIIDKRGFVVTNWHVVERASTISIISSDEKQYPASLIGADPRSDVAVLKIESHDEFLPIHIGTSDDIMIGETVIAIGNPFGLSHTVTTGVVSALQRSVKAHDRVFENFIQTDASINPGNSGGPLLNIKGELIGINTAIYGEAEGIGFAIPINTAMNIVNDLIKYGTVRPAWIGIEVQDLTPEIARHLGYDHNYGVIVSDVLPESPAREAGIKTGDIISAIDGKRIQSRAKFKRILSIYTAETTLKANIFSSGTVKTTDIKTAAFPENHAADILRDTIGIEVITNSRSVAQRMGLASASGVVITETFINTQASRKGLSKGDIILKIQGREIEDTEHLKKLILENIYLDSMVFLVQRGRYGYNIAFEM